MSIQVNDPYERSPFAETVAIKLDAAGSNALPSITGYEPGVWLSEAATVLKLSRALYWRSIEKYDSFISPKLVKVSCLGFKDTI